MRVHSSQLEVINDNRGRKVRFEKEEKVEKRNKNMGEKNKHIDVHRFV